MDLKSEIQNMKIIDHHLHAVDGWYWMKCVGSDPFAALHAKAMAPAKTAMLPRRKFMADAYRALYGFPHDAITPENMQELEDCYHRGHSIDEAEMVIRAMDKAGIESAMEMCLSGPELPPGLDPKRFARAQLVDGLLLPLDNSGIGTAQKSKQFVKLAEPYAFQLCQQYQPRTLDDYLVMVSSALEALVKEGVIALKMNTPYWRDIAVDEVDKDEANDVWEKRDTSPVRYKRLQDFIMRHMIAKAAVLDLPIHIHTGAAGAPHAMELADPSRLDPFLWLPDIKPTKFVLLHGGYPFCRKTGFMAGRTGDAPSVYLDISFLTLNWPPASESIADLLRDWLLAGLAEKMIYGSDSPTPLGIYMSAMKVRHDLYLTLKGLIADGYLDDELALSLAKLILRENAKRLYKNKI